MHCANRRRRQPTEAPSADRDISKAEEFFPKSVFVFSLGFFCLVAGFFFSVMRGFPLIDLGNGVVARGKVLFFTYRCDPRLNRCLISTLFLIEFLIVVRHLGLSLK